MMNVDDSVIDIIRQSALMYNVDKIILFGSRAKGNGNDRSDYDLLVFGGDYYGFCDYMQIHLTGSIFPMAIMQELTF